jgi:hypothetical protein
MRYLSTLTLVIALMTCTRSGSDEETTTKLSFCGNAEFAVPSFGYGESDHGVVAFNDSNDLCVAFQTRSNYPDGPWQVEAVVLEYMGEGQWDCPSRSSVLVLGSPQGVLPSADQEECKKPDIVAIGDDFFVVWTRLDQSDLQTNPARTGIIECASIRKDSSGWTLDTSSAGVGFPLDSLVVPGRAGCMPALARLDQSSPYSIGVVYTSETARSIGTIEFEYSVQFLGVNPNDLTSFTGPHSLVDDVPFDWNASDLSGRILPDAVGDDDGNLVVIWEALEDDGTGTNSRLGSIHIASFSDPTAGLPSTSPPLDGRQDYQIRRRPNLSTEAGSPNTLLASWGVGFDTTNGNALGDWDTTVLLLDMTNLTAGQPAVTELPFPNLPNLHHKFPLPAIHGGQSTCFLTEGNYSLSFWNGDPSPEPEVSLLTTSTVPATRPSVAAGELEDSRSILAATWEAPDASSSRDILYIRVFEG